MTDSFLYTVPAAAFLLDTIVGDPRTSLHPVVLIGRLISFLESLLYPMGKQTPGNLLLRGGLVVILVVAVTGIISYGLLCVAALAGFLGEFVMGAVILYFTITPRALARDGVEIYRLLKAGDIPLARKRLSWIVGRDTDNLDEADISRGAVETIAENTTDGILSPLFYFLLFGPVGAMCYRAANTMDSMLGYKNDRYLYFGRTAARVDDVLNYIPARITFLLFVTAAFLLNLDWKHAWKVGVRDAPKHPSPNGGYAEGPVAGALRVQLGGWNYYEGKPEFREYMGDPIRPLVGGDILQSLKVMYAATLLFLVAETIFLYYEGNVCILFWSVFSF